MFAKIHVQLSGGGASRTTWINFDRVLGIECQYNGSNQLHQLRLLLTTGAWLPIGAHEGAAEMLAAFEEYASQTQAVA